MLVSNILVDKGDLVVTIHPDTSLEHAARQLAAHGVGALVASEDAVTIAGILSERDVVRHVARYGAAALGVPVRTVMTRDVITCRPHDTCADLMRTMTTRRVRHLPVVVDGRLAGMVSIGDVVKRRVGELETETAELQAYFLAG